MDNEITERTNSLLEMLTNQIVFLLDILSRPVVQQQIIVFVMIVVLTWLFVEGFRRRQGRRHTLQDLLIPAGVSRRLRLQAIVFFLLTPTLSLASLYLASWLFARQRQPNGLLQELTILIWIWLIYRVLLIIIYIRFGEATRQYQKWIMIPFFLFLVGSRLLSFLPGSFALLDATIPLGTLSFSVRSLIAASIVLYLFIVIGWVVKLMMVNSLPSRLNIEYGAIESIGTLTRYALNALGIIFALGMLGLDFATLAIIAGGLSVGVGMGLVDIILSFISGLLILSEQTLRPGDVVELEDRIGKVEKISLRTTTVRTNLNEEFIIPNNKFITQKVVNLSKSDRLIQNSIPFAVSHGSDPEFIRQLALDTCTQHLSVSDDPAPELLFNGYHNGSLNFNLIINLKHPQHIEKVKSDLYFMLWEAFKVHEIKISG